MKFAKRLPSEWQNKYYEKATETLNFNQIIKEEVEEVNKMITIIKTKLQKSMWDKTTDEGILTHDKDAYLSCLKLIDHQKLEKYLGKDV